VSDFQCPDWLQTLCVECAELRASHRFVRGILFDISSSTVVVASSRQVVVIRVTVNLIRAKYPIQSLLIRRVVCAS
jgi:hypothetical protein